MGIYAVSASGRKNCFPGLWPKLKGAFYLINPLDLSNQNLLSLTMSASTKNTQMLQQASDKQLEEASAENHRQLFCLNAESEGGEVQYREGIT